MRDMFTMMQSATQKAFDRIGKVTGQSGDPDLNIYNNLKPEHFTKLMEEYGEQNVIDYIKTMEFKRTSKGG